MTPGGRRLGFVLGAVAIVLVVLPAVHELGHVLAAALVGAEVGDVTWTLLGGHAPSTSLVSASPEAVPWIDAGGLLLPTALGLALLGVWILCCARPHAPVWMLLLLGGVCLAGNALGCVSEAFAPSASYAHLRGLAQRLGLSGGAAIGLQIAPALVVLSAYVLVFVRVRSFRTAAAAECRGSEGP